jgi:hypothetical protein
LCLVADGAEDGCAAGLEESAADEAGCADDGNVTAPFVADCGFDVTVDGFGSSTPSMPLMMACTRSSKSSSSDHNGCKTNKIAIFDVATETASEPL